MIRISQLKLKVGHTREQLFEEIIHLVHWIQLMQSLKMKRNFFQPKKVNGQNHLFQTIPFHIVIVKKQECLSKKKNWKNDQ